MKPKKTRSRAARGRSYCATLARLVLALIAIRALPALAGEQPTNAYWPEVSPDGRQVLFMSPERGGPVHVMNADGSNPHLLTHGTRAAWFPSGKRIVVVVRSKPTSHLVIMNADGSAPHRIARDFTPVLWRPRISPDGKTIVIANIWPPDKPDDFHLIALDGKDVGRLHPKAPGQCIEPTWSHDGRLAYVCSTQDSKGNVSSTTLWTMNANGSRQRLLATMQGGAQWISWSPDDKQIALQDDDMVRKDGNILIVDVATGKMKAITHHDRAYFDETPSWSSNGYIYFQSNRSGHYAIYRMRPDGSHQQRLTP